MSLINELKRRNVFKVAGAYLAIGWVITQVTGAVVPALNLPASLVPIVVWIGIIGFPCAMIFSWVYELTPEGLKRESEVDRSQSITHLTSKRLDYIIIAMLAVAIALFALQYFRPRSEAPAPAAASVADVAAPNAGPGPAPVITVDEQSIAVLPFVNMSEESSNEFFADGISEELLNLLAKIPQLHVAARTSSFAFKGKDVGIPEIARRLHVAHVLEGSVRKSGNHVRITTQLIRAHDGYHLWSETYDRTLDDIFVVQDEIAGAVVEKLKIALLGKAPKAHEVAPEVYALYLQARQLSHLFSAEGFERSNALYQQALAINPAYAEAWSALARNYSDQAAFGLRPIDEGNQLARDAANRALATDPDMAQAHAGLGDIAMYYDGDSLAAARHYERALQLEPTNSDIIGGAGILAQSLGRMDNAIALVEYAVAHDPMNPTGHFRLGYMYTYAGRLDDAIRSARVALNLNSETMAARLFLGIALLLKGDARAALAEIQQESDEGFRMIGLPLVYRALGRHRESDAALAELIETKEKLASYNIAYVLAYRGESDRAFQWLDKAVAYHDAGLSEIVVQPLFANIRGDPRWLPFLQKIDKAPEQLAAIKFDVKVPQ